MEQPDERLAEGEDAEQTAWADFFARLFVHVSESRPGLPLARIVRWLAETTRYGYGGDYYRDHPIVAVVELMTPREKHLELGNALISLDRGVRWWRLEFEAQEELLREFARALAPHLRLPDQIAVNDPPS